MVGASVDGRSASWLRRAFEWYAIDGAERNTPDERIAILFFAIIVPVIALAFLPWVVFYFMYEPPTYWPAAVVCLLTIIFGLPLPFIARRSRLAAEFGFALIPCATFSALVYMFGAESGLHIGLLAGCLILMMETGTRRWKVLLFCMPVLLALFVALPLWFPAPVLFREVEDDLLRLIFLNNALGLIISVFICILLALRRAETAEEALSEEFGRSESLLSNLLPTDIAARLKDKPGEVIADEISAVTILFADIVDFTPRAASMKPEALVAFLNRIFSRFDELTARHGLEKIKTIGDAYMVAGGMPSPRPDHAETVARMALEMLEATKRLSAEAGEKVEVRIGLHTGRAVAGVIGSNKVFYDVWGDTVNMAARLESHGEPGRIQVSAATRDALQTAFDFERRGVVDIKGVGPAETYWLLPPTH